MDSIKAERYEEKTNKFRQEINARMCLQARPFSRFVVFRHTPVVFPHLLLSRNYAGIFLG